MKIDFNQDAFQAARLDYISKEPGFQVQLDSMRKWDFPLRLYPPGERSIMEGKVISGSEEVQNETLNSLADAPRFSDLLTSHVLSFKVRSRAILLTLSGICREDSRCTNIVCR